MGETRVLDAAFLHNWRQECINKYGYDPCNNPRVMEDMMLKSNSAWLHEMNQQINLKYKLEYQSRREEQKFMDAAGTAVYNLNGTIVFQKRFGGRPQQLCLFYGVIVAVEVYVNEKSKERYFRFCVQITEKLEQWTQFLPEKSYNDNKNFIRFMSHYLWYQAPDIPEKEWIPHFKKYLEDFKASQEVVPFRTGWHHEKTDTAEYYKYYYHGAYGREIPETEQIKERFLVCEPEKLDELVSFFTKRLERHKGTEGVLFLYHFLSVFRMWMGYPLPEKQLLIVAPQSKRKMAVNMLKVLHKTDGDIVYAANSNVAKLSRNLTRNPDDVTLIVMDGTSPYLKSKIITTVKNADYVDLDDGIGIKQTLPVFFDDHLGNEYNQENFQIIDLSDYTEDCDFDELSRKIGSLTKIIFEIWEESGTHWCNCTKQLYGCYLNDEKKRYNTTRFSIDTDDCCQMNAMLLTTVHVLYKILMQYCKNKKQVSSFTDCLIDTVKKYRLKEQRENDPVDYFVSQVKNIAERGELQFCRYKKTGMCMGPKVYFDNSKYYFPESLIDGHVFKNIDSAMRLTILRELKEMGFLHTYDVSNKGYKTRFTLTNDRGARIKIKGYIFDRSLFEIPCGIKLYER